MQYAVDKVEHGYFIRCTPFGVGGEGPQALAQRRLEINKTALIEVLLRRVQI